MSLNQHKVARRAHALCADTREYRDSDFVTYSYRRHLARLHQEVLSDRAQMPQVGEGAMHRPAAQARRYVWAQPSEASKASLLRPRVSTPTHRMAPSRPPSASSRAIVSPCSPEQRSPFVDRKRMLASSAISAAAQTTPSPPEQQSQFVDRQRMLASSAISAAARSAPSLSMNSSQMSFSPSVLMELSNGDASFFMERAHTVRAHSAYARTLEKRSSRVVHTREPPALDGMLAKPVVDQRRSSEQVSEEVASIMQGSPWTPRLTHLRRSPSSISPSRSTSSGWSTSSGRSSAVSRSPSTESIVGSSTVDSSASLPVWPRHWNRDKQSRSRHSSSFNATERATKCCWIPVRPVPLLKGEPRWA